MTTTGTAAKKSDRLRSKFGVLLAEKRKRRGFKTAYAFFHDSGGAKRFGFTFQQYVRVEKGLRLPSAEGLHSILEVLLSPEATHSHDRKELLIVYLRATVGGAKLFEPLFRELDERVAEPALSGGSLADEVLGLAVRRDHSDSTMMSGEQWRAVIGEDTTFWVLQWLLRTGLSQRADQVARALGVPQAAVERALATLTTQGLLKRGADGAWTCPHFEGDLSTPSGAIGGLASSKKIWACVERRLENPEKARYNCGFVVLALERPEKQYAKLVSLMSEALWKCYLFRQGKRPFHGSLVSVEYRLTAPKPFSTEVED